MYKKAFARRLKDNKFLVHLWEDSGYSKIEWDNQAYIECSESEANYKGLNGEPLKRLKIIDLITQIFISMICLHIRNS